MFAPPNGVRYLDSLMRMRSFVYFQIGNINYNPLDERRYIVPYFEKFFAQAPEWRIIVFSGDVDSAVPFLGTQRWIECLGRKHLQPWQTWSHEGNYGGTVDVYDGITFLTIRGAGAKYSLSPLSECRPHGALLPPSSGLWYD